MSKGRYGIYGGQYIPETLMKPVEELLQAYEACQKRPSVSERIKGASAELCRKAFYAVLCRKNDKGPGRSQDIFKARGLKPHRLPQNNNVLGQVLLAKKMGKTRIIAETGAGQHGVAAATAAALMGMECEIFMGEEDTKRQALNVFRMELLGAKVHAVTSGTGTLKDAVNEAMREWTRRMEESLYVLGSVMGPHPFPMMVRVPEGYRRRD